MAFGSAERPRLGTRPTPSGLVRHLLSLLLLTVLAAPSAAQSSQPCGRARLAAPDANPGPVSATSTVCRDSTGAWEILVNVTGDTPAAETPDPLPPTCGDHGSCVSVHFVTGEGERYIVAVDREGRRVLAWLAEEREALRSVAASDLPVTLNLSPGTDSLWQAKFRLESGTEPERVVLKADGREWTLTLGPDRSEPVAGANAPPVRLTGTHVTGRVDDGVPGSRLLLGARLAHEWDDGTLRAAISPGPPFHPWEPFRASANRQYPRVLPDERSVMEPWRQARGSFTWLDSRRVDVEGGYLAAHDSTYVDGRFLAGVTETGALSVAALSLGDIGAEPLGVRAAVMREPTPRDAHSRLSPWMAVVGMGGRVGGDSVKTLTWDWNATGPARRTEDWAQAIRLGTQVNRGSFLLALTHERIGEGFTRGAAFAPYEEMEFTSAVAGLTLSRDTLLVQARYLTRSEGDVWTAAPHDRDASRDLAVSFGANLHPLGGLGVRLKTSFRTQRYPAGGFGPYPGGSMTVRYQHASRDILWALSASIEGARTQVYAAAAPGRTWSAGGDVTIATRWLQWRTGTRWETVHVCGASLLSPGAEVKGCSPYARLGAVESKAVATLGSRLSLRADLRWLEERAYSVERTSHRLDGRLEGTLAVTSDAQVAFGLECTMSGKRSLCGARTTVEVVPW